MKRTILEINEQRTITAAALKRLARMAFYRHLDIHYYFYLYRTIGGRDTRRNRRAAEAVDLATLLLGEEAVDLVFEDAKARFIQRIGHQRWIDAMETDPLPDSPILPKEQQ
jgi:hypothetical protein